MPRSPPIGLWVPDGGRLSSPVLRAARRETPGRAEGSPIADKAYESPSLVRSAALSVLCRPPVRWSSLYAALMSTSDNDLWTSHSERLLESLQRFRDALGAVRELADFATEHVAKLDERGKDFQFSISDRNLTEFDPKVSKAVVDFMHRSVGLAFQSLVKDEDRDLQRLLQNGPEAVNMLAAQYVKLAQQDEAMADKGLDISVFHKALSRREVSRTRTDLLLASLLTAVVGDFEVLFSAIATYFYRVRPEALRSQDSQIMWSEIEEYGSLDELRSHYVEERVSQLMWKGFDEWMKWLTSQLKINYENAALNTVITTEIFQRRHIIVHNGGVVSPQYLAKTLESSSHPKLGEQLSVDRQYLDSAIDQLTVLGLSLVCQVMRKLAKNPHHHHQVDENIMEFTLSLLREKRWKCAQRLADITLGQIRGNYPHLAVQVNRWIAIKRSGEASSIYDEVLAWDVSALQKRFKLARLILLDDESAIELARELLAIDEINQRMVDSWPLFEGIRDKINRVENDPSVLGPDQQG